MAKEYTTENKSKLLWKKATDTILQAIHHDHTSVVDTVKVRIANKFYLQELAQHKQIDETRSSDQELLILKMTPEQLTSHQLQYDGELLRRVNGDIADTSGQFSKGKPGQIFVMSKEGTIYTGTHGEISEANEKVVHGSFLNDRPAEMAGMIELKEGKIASLSNNSGHYAPDELDMYRGIAHIKAMMPNIFTEDCKIDIAKQVGKERISAEENLNSFMARMETIGENGLPYHVTLRNARIDLIQETKTRLRSMSEPVTVRDQKQLNYHSSLMSAIEEGASLHSSGIREDHTTAKKTSLHSKKSSSKTRATSI